MPPGLEPIPLDHSSSPGWGRRSMPVKTMSKNTVPESSTSSGGSDGARSEASGSQSCRSAASGGAGVAAPGACEAAADPSVRASGRSVITWRLLRASRG